MKKIISCIFIISILMLSLTSCLYIHNGVPKFRNEWSELEDQAMDTVLYTARNAEGDKEKIYEILKNIYTKDEFDAEYERLHSILEEMGTEFSLSVVSYTSTEENGVVIKNGVFGLRSDKGNYIFKASTRSDMDGLASFSMEPDTEGVLSPEE